MKKRKWLWIVLALLLFGCVGTVITQLGGSGNNNGANDSATEQVTAVSSSGTEKQAPAVSELEATRSPKPTNTPKPEPTATVAPAIGQDVDTGEVLWVVVEAQNLGQTLKSDNQFVDSKKTEGYFVKVRYKVENQGNDKRYYESPALVDVQGREFSDYDDALFFLTEDETCILQELGPNVPKTCVEIYEVAADATDLRARVTGALFDKTIEVDLGLK